MFSIGLLLHEGKTKVKTCSQIQHNKKADKGWRKDRGVRGVWGSKKGEVGKIVEEGC